MAYAFAVRERDARTLESEIELVTGGTQPAGQIHPEVLGALDDVGIDISDRRPREVTFEELQSSDYVITMGCSAEDVCPAGWSGDSRDWNLEDPDGRPFDEALEIRDEIKQNVGELFEELSSK